ncbi:transposase [Streptomyces sp. NPDC001571]
MARGDLTDRQWARLEPLLLAGKTSGRPRTWARRRLIDGIRSRTRAGTLWRGVPERYCPTGPGLRPVPPLAARRHMEADPGTTARPSRCIGPDRRGPLSRQPAVPARPRTHPSASHRPRTPAHHAGQGQCRQCLRIPRETLLAVQAQDRMRHPGAGRPGTQTQEARLPGRPATGLRQGRLQGTPHRGVRDQPAETEPRCGHEIRQIRRPIRGDRAGRSPQRVAVTSAFGTDSRCGM